MDRGASRLLSSRIEKASTQENKYQTVNVGCKPRSLGPEIAVRAAVERRITMAL